MCAMGIVGGLEEVCLLSDSYKTSFWRKDGRKIPGIISNYVRRTRLCGWFGADGRLVGAGFAAGAAVGDSATAVSPHRCGQQPQNPRRRRAHR